LSDQTRTPWLSFHWVATAVVALEAESLFLIVCGHTLAPNKSVRNRAAYGTTSGRKKLYLVRFMFLKACSSHLEEWTRTVGVV
jgi:hypothetical protein